MRARFFHSLRSFFVTQTPLKAIQVYFIKQPLLTNEQVFACLQCSFHTFVATELSSQQKQIQLPRATSHPHHGLQNSFLYWSDNLKWTSMLFFHSASSLLKYPLFCKGCPKPKPTLKPLTFKKLFHLAKCTWLGRRHLTRSSAFLHLHIAQQQRWVENGKNSLKVAFRTKVFQGEAAKQHMYVHMY